jgi:hypothetical protein
VGAHAFCPLIVRIPGSRTSDPSPAQLPLRVAHQARPRVAVRAGAGDWGAAKGGGLLEQHEILLSELALSNPLEMPAVVEANADRLDESFYNCAPPTRPSHAHSSSTSFCVPLTPRPTTHPIPLPSHHHSPGDADYSSTGCK